MTLIKCKDCTFSSSLESFIDEHIANTGHEMEYVDGDDDS